MRTCRSLTAMAIALALSAGVAAGQSDEPPPDAVHITGEHSLGELLSSGSWTRTDEGVRQLRGLEALQVDAFSDPRFSGETHLIHGEDVYPSGLGPRWGVVRLENEGGTWSGSYVAWVLPRDEGPDIPIYTTLFEGEGGYAGLSALCQSTYPEGRGWDGVSECIVFPGSLPRLVLPE